jgi:ATP-dependent protease ClpP protease subunit
VCIRQIKVALPVLSVLATFNPTIAAAQNSTRQCALILNAIMSGHREWIQSNPRLQSQLLLVVWIIAFHCLLTVAARADFRIVGRTVDLELLISGTITQQDAKAFQEVSAELERNDFYVYLDSKGGDVLAAMQIGRLIRKYEGFTQIQWSRKCYSSCALIFIAGVSRVISATGGELGLHRPYLASAPQSREAVEKQVPLILSQVKQYVAEMGITENFYQQMVNTEPSQIVVYGRYSKFIPEYDPVYQEVEISYRARSYGVTTSKMRQREIDADACKKDEIDQCGEPILWGLSQLVYRERSEKARACRLDDDNTKLLQAMPKKERRDHPLWIKRETCIRNIMLGRS